MNMLYRSEKEEMSLNWTSSVRLYSAIHVTGSRWKTRTTQKKQTQQNKTTLF